MQFAYSLNVTVSIFEIDPKIQNVDGVYIKTIPMFARLE